jgi:hypothetical protein
MRLLPHTSSNLIRSSLYQGESITRFSLLRAQILLERFEILFHFAGTVRMQKFFSLLLYRVFRMKYTYFLKGFDMIGTSSQDCKINKYLVFFSKMSVLTNEVPSLPGTETH